VSCAITFVKVLVLCVKVKLDGGANGPSRVVHIRSLPHEVAETDVVQLGMPFGKMTNVLVLKQKNQVTACHSPRSKWTIRGQNGP
jgi:hypothetical protein